MGIRGDLATLWLDYAKALAFFLGRWLGKRSLPSALTTLGWLAASAATDRFHMLQCS